MNLSIVIPAFNEAERLPPTLRRIRAYMEQAHAGAPIEIIVVDDGSTDRTAALARQTDPGIRLISHPRNMGKGAAVRSGMLAARGEWRYLCDADLSTPIEEIEKFLALTGEADIIIGSRGVPGADIRRRQALWKVALGRAGNLLMRLLAVPGVRDSQCGFKLYAARTMRIFELQRIDHWGYDFEDLFLARKAGWRIKELPVEWTNDPHSKVKGFDYLRTLYELLSVRLNDWRGLYRGT